MQKNRHSCAAITGDLWPVLDDITGPVSFCLRSEETNFVISVHTFRCIQFASEPWSEFTTTLTPLLKNDARNIAEILKGFPHELIFALSFLCFFRLSNDLLIISHLFVRGFRTVRDQMVFTASAVW